MSYHTFFKGISLRYIYYIRFVEVFITIKLSKAINNNILKEATMRFSVEIRVRKQNTFFTAKKHLKISKMNIKLRVILYKSKIVRLTSD